MANAYVDLDPKKRKLFARKRAGVGLIGAVGAGVSQLAACWDGLLSAVGDSLASLLISYSAGGTLTHRTEVAHELTGACFPGNTLLVVGGLDSAGDGVSHIYSGAIGTVSSNMAGFNTGNDVLRIATNGTTVVVATGNQSGYGFGAQGELWSSTATPPFSFTLRNDSAAENANSVVFANGLYMAIYGSDLSESSKAAWSSDNGVTWSTHAFTGPVLFCVVWDGAAWWFGGATSSTLLTPAWYKTTDLITFTSQSLSVPGGTKIFIYAGYGNGKFVAAVLNGVTRNTLSSLDGLTWVSESNLPQGTSTYADFAFSNGLLYCRLPTLTKTWDGTSWTTVITSSLTSGSAIAVTPNGSKLVISDFSSGYWSADLIGSVTVTPTTIGPLNPITAGLQLLSESTGAAASTQALLMKTSQQAWLYTK